MRNNLWILVLEKTDLGYGCEKLFWKMKDFGRRVKGKLIFPSFQFIKRKLLYLSQIINKKLLSFSNYYSIFYLS
jgi:hypothetical protein